MPTIITKGTLSAQPLGFVTGGGTGPTPPTPSYWILNIQSPDYIVSSNINDVFFNSNGDIIATTTKEVSGPYSYRENFYTIQSDGTVVVQEDLSKIMINGLIGPTTNFGSGFDSANNIYTFTSEIPAADDINYVAKYDLTGSSLWQNGIITYSSSEFGYGYWQYAGVAATAANNPVAYGTLRDINTDIPGYEWLEAIFFNKFNSLNGTDVSKASFTSSRTDAAFNPDTTYAADYFQISKCVQDSAGNLYCLGCAYPTVNVAYSVLSVGEIAQIVFKLDSSFNPIWSYAVNTGFGVSRKPETGPSFITLDESNNCLYITGRAQAFAGNPKYTYLAKISTSGAIQNVITLNDGQGYQNVDGFNAVTTDSVGNVYVAYNKTLSGPYGIEPHIYCFDGSGSLVWHNTMSYTGNINGMKIMDLKIQGTDLLIWMAQANGEGNVLVKTLKDGSQIGTYAVGVESFTMSAATIATSTTSWATLSYPLVSFDLDTSPNYPGTQTGNITPSSISNTTSFGNI